MIISDAYEFVYIHAPKTGGKSVMLSLPEGSPRHNGALSYFQIHETLPAFQKRQPSFIRYKTFSTVRHPARRFRSLYQFLKQRTPTIPEMIPIENIDQFAQAVEADILLTITDKESIRKELINHLAQPLTVVLGIGQTKPIDRWYKLEQLHEEWNQLLMWLGLSYRPLQYVNESIPMLIQGKRWKDFVRDYYRNDFENFKYSWTF